MDVQEHQTVWATVRAPRVAVAYESSASWVSTARKVISSISRTWGSAGAVLIPIEPGAGAADRLLPMLRLYDPDYVFIHVPTVNDMRESDPEKYERLVAANRMEHESVGEVSARIDGENLPIAELGPLASQLAKWCSPMKNTFIDDAGTVFRVADIHRLHAKSAPRLLTEMPAIPDLEPITLDLSEIDPRLALAVETRIGTLDSAQRVRMGSTHVPMADSDTRSLIALSMGEDTPEATLNSILSDLGEVSSSPLGDESFSRRTVFARSSHALVKATSGLRPPIVVAIGDTAADHALAALCDRTFTRGIWISPKALQDFGERNAQLITSTIDHIRYREYPEVAVHFTSASLDKEGVKQFVESQVPSHVITDLEGVPIDVGPGEPSYVDVATLGKIADRYTLIDEHNWNVRRTVPTLRSSSGTSLLTPLDLPIPTAADTIGPHLVWQHDVGLGANLPPARSALSTSVLSHSNRPFTDAIVRAGRNGLSFGSTNMGLVMMSAPLRERVANPLLRFPSATDIFRCLAESAGASFSLSDAGRRALNVVELWGSPTELSKDLSGDTRSLLDMFRPPKAGQSGSYESGYAIRGLGYITITHAAGLLGASESRDLIDSLLDRRILKRGFILSCERCRWEEFYAAEAVGQEFRCGACDHSNKLVKARWAKIQAESEWHYSLDQVVRLFFEQNGDLPVLAAHRYSANSRNFIWGPEHAIGMPSDEIEIDLCFVCDEKIVVGEAKSNGQLVGKRNARRLVTAARILSADVILLATSMETWKGGAVGAVEEAVESIWGTGPRPEVVQLTGVA